MRTFKVYVCTNTCENGKCCAAKGSLSLIEQLREMLIEQPIPHAQVEVYRAPCMNLCGKGIVALINPTNKHITHLQNNSAQKIHNYLKELL